MKGLTFSNKHSYKDFGLILSNKSIQPPSKKKIKESVPFMHGSYDFSTIGSSGEIIYDGRVISVTFGLPSLSKTELHCLYSKVLMWLEDVPKNKLIFDDITDCYFMGEVETTPSFEEMMHFGRLTVSFICEPFKIGKDLVGQEQWDILNFETDILQDIEFDIVGNKTISIYNPGRTISPRVNCSSNMIVINNGYTANFIVGDNIDWKLKLQQGINNIIVTGVGNIKFILRKEML